MQFKEKNLAELAIGESLPAEFYSGLHDLNIAQLGDHEPDENINVIVVESSGVATVQNDISIYCAEDDSLKLEALDSLSKAFETLRAKVENGEKSLLLGVTKFQKRIEKMNASQLASHLHTFGVQQFRRKNITSASSSLLKRSQKFKIGVQPEAVKRRKIKNGSKRALAKGKSSMMLPIKSVSYKRKHEFSLNVQNNEPVAKKAGRSMMSKTKTTANISSHKNNDQRSTIKKDPSI